MAKTKRAKRAGQASSEALDVARDLVRAAERQESLRALIHPVRQQLGKLWSDIAGELRSVSELARARALWLRAVETYTAACGAVRTGWRKNGVEIPGAPCLSLRETPDDFAMRIAKLQLAHSADQRASEFLNRDLLAVIKQTATELRLELEISKYKPELLEALRLDILGVGLTHAAAVAQHRASGASPRPRARGRPPDPFMKMLAVDAARKGIPPAVMKRALSEGKSSGVAETRCEAFRKAHRAARWQSKLDASWMEGSLTELREAEERLAEKRAAKGAAKKGGE